jgi:DNA-binding PadR family transcriptional regulator
MAFVCVIIKTIYLEEEKSWYKRKKPQLQIEILACLAVRGNLSKSKLRSLLTIFYYNDISHAVDSLHERRFIEREHTDTSGHGRPEKYYRITELGLEILIRDDPTPEKFWKAMIGFCHHSKSIINSVRFKKFYQLFIDRFFKYSVKPGYFFRLDLFNNLQSRWLEQNAIFDDDRIGLEQQIFEVLALNPKISLGELLKKTNQTNEASLKKILSIYLPISHKPLIIGKDIPSSKTISHDNLLLRNTIIIKQNAFGKPIFELSLLGIMLVLTLIRYDKGSNLKHGLYYHDVSHEEYYDKIANNYKEKLPLIFEKRHLLKKVLGDVSIYNFDIILDKEYRVKESEKSITNRGSKEFYEGVESLRQYTRVEMIKIQSTGLEMLLNYKAGAFHQNPNIKKMQPIISKILEISCLLSPLESDPSSFIETMKEIPNSCGFDSNQIQAISRSYETETIEKAFADLISFFYYLNLNLESLGVINTINPQDIASLRERFYPLSPRQIAISIFRRDRDIREWFSGWIMDLVNHEHGKVLMMQRIQNEINLSE